MTVRELKDILDKVEDDSLDVCVMASSLDIVSALHVVVEKDPDPDDYGCVLIYGGSPSEEI
jgi:hypothetical protein